MSIYKNIFYWGSLTIIFIAFGCQENPTNNNDDNLIISEKEVKDKILIKETYPDSSSRLIKWNLWYCTVQAVLEDSIELTFCQTAQDGGFWFDLPDLIKKEQLRTDYINDSLESEPKGVRATKAVRLFVSFYIDSVKVRKEIFYHSLQPTATLKPISKYYYMAFDRDGIIKGTDIKGNKYDLNFKKGWNLLEVIDTAGTEYRIIPNTPSNAKFYIEL